MNSEVADKPKSHTRVVTLAVLVSLGMFGFGFALVPFYDVFCELTGLNGKVKTEAATEAGFKPDYGRQITLEFVTSVNGGMPLKFRAESEKLKELHPGEYYTVNFFAENTSDRQIVGRAIPSVAPGLATQYLNKTECFCFSEQVFEPHRERKMPVRFAIDPAISDQIKDLTLSYTFFDITDKASK